MPFSWIPLAALELQNKIPIPEISSPLYSIDSHSHYSYSGHYGPLLFEGVIYSCLFVDGLAHVSACGKPRLRSNAFLCYSLPEFFFSDRVSLRTWSSLSTRLADQWTPLGLPTQHGGYKCMLPHSRSSFTTSLGLSWGPHAHMSICVLSRLPSHFCCYFNHQYLYLKI